MKKVLFTATVDSHILSFHLPYLKWFKEKGYEVHVATNSDIEIPYCDVKHKVSFERSPLKMNNIKAIKELKEIIDEEKFKIIHTHTPMGAAVTRLAAKNARKKFQTKVMYTAHGFHFFKGSPIFYWLIYYPIEKYLARYTDCLITINEEDYKRAKDKFKVNQIELVHGVGVEEAKFKCKLSNEEKNQLKEKLQLEIDDFILIQVGELNKNKNQVMAIETMNNLVKEYPNIHLLIVGEGVLEAEYKEKIKEYGLEDHIQMLGYREDINNLLGISNILLSLSYREGLPVNVVEGAMAEKTIIATDCRGNRDLVKDGKNGYIIPINDNEQLQKKILKIYNGDFTFSNISFKEYRLENVVQEYTEIYNNILKKG